MLRLLGREVPLPLQGRAVFGLHRRESDRPFGADGHAVSAVDADFVCSIDGSGDPLALLDLDDADGTDGHAVSVEPALAFIHQYVGHDVCSFHCQVALLPG
jgi:hypothetical protein